MTGVYEGSDTSVPLDTFAYNPDDTLRSRSEAQIGGGTAAYTYDPIGRLATQTDAFPSFTAKNVGWAFGLNPASQITSEIRDNDAYAFTGIATANKTYTVNGLNQYTAVAGTGHTYDANGNLTGDGTNAYIYDGENRLVSATAAGVTATLTYDPLGRLFQVVKGGANTRFVYDGDAMVAEYDGGGLLVNRYVHGSNAAADDPLLWYRGATKRYLHADHLGSIVAATNAASTPSVNSYDEYGVPAAANVGRFQYTGQIWLSELGLYHYKARLYSPYLGRFLQTDPVGYRSQINLYAYGGDDPINASDPTGLQSVYLGTDYAPEAQAVATCHGDAACEKEIRQQFFDMGLLASSFVPVEALGLKAFAWGGRSLGLSRIARPAFAEAKALISARYLAGEATKGRTRQFIGEGGRDAAERLFGELTGSGGKALDRERTVVGALGDGSKVNIRTEALSNGAQRTTVEIQREAATGTRIPERIKVRFDDDPKYQ